MSRDLEILNRSWFIVVAVIVTLTFASVPSASAQHLLWENKGQAEFGGVARDVAIQGRVLVASGGLFDEQDRLRWFVRAQDRVTGATLWEDQLEPEIAIFDAANEVAVDQGRAFAAGFIYRDETGFVFTVRAYDLKTGALLWDQRLKRRPGPFGGDTAKVVAARDGRVFVGGYFLEAIGGFNFALLAFDGRTGALLCERVKDSGGDDAAWSVAVSGDRVFVAGDIDGFTPGQFLVIRAHAAGSGDLLWEKAIEGATNFYAEEDALHASGRLVFAAGMLEDGDFIVRAYEASSGELQWSTRIEVGNRAPQGLDLTTSNGQLFAAGVLDCDPETFVECKLFVHAYDASTGELLWRDTNQSPGNDWFVQGLTAGAGRVFVGGARLNEAGDYTAAIRAYDSKAGRLTWEEDFDGGGTAFESVWDLFWDSGRLFVLGQLSNPDKHSDFFVRAYALDTDQGRAARCAAAHCAAKVLARHGDAR